MNDLYPKWMPPSLSKLTSIILNMELTHFGSEASKYYPNRHHKPQERGKGVICVQQKPLESVHPKIPVCVGRAGGRVGGGEWNGHTPSG